MYKTLVFFAFLCFGSVAHAQTELTVYTALDAKMLRQYSDAFEKMHPDITLRWVRASTGPITARLLAEKNAPQADVVFGVALTSLYAVDKTGIFASYSPPDKEALLVTHVDQRSEPTWVGIDGLASALCVNTVELENNNLPMPTSWKDLVNPVYKGHIVIASPASSGIGAMNLQAWLATADSPDAAWEYMQDLVANAALISPSGCSPCQMAAMGEAVIGITAAHCSRPFVIRHAPLAVIYPSEGVGWDVEGAAMIKSSPRQSAAQKLLDFASSPEASAITVANSCIPARKDALDSTIAQLVQALIPLDLEAAAEQKASVVNKWRQLCEPQ